MAKYSDIKGFTVQTVSSDPVASQFEGGSWASGGALNSERSQMAGVGSQTAALGFGGNTPGSPKSAANEQYNGSSWTEVGDLNSARAGMYGFGTTTAAIGSGGLVYPFNPSNFATNLTESWNGSAWTETSDMTYGRATGGSATSGTSTAGLIFGGGYLSPSPNYALVAYTESWNGSGWTETADLNSARGYGMGGAGTQTSALAFGGNIPPSPSTTLIATESWDGSSWTEVNDMNTKREGVAGSGADNTSAIAVAGNVPPLTGITEIWNGTSWTEVADLSTARTSVGSAGTTVASLAFGGGVPGSSPSISTLTEEFTAPAVFSKTTEGQLFFNSTANAFKETISDVPGTSWSSGPAVNSTKSFNNGAGDLTSAITFGGAPSPTQAYSEQWNGSTWTEVSDLNEGRQAGSAGGASGTDAIMGGGYEGPNVSNSVNTEIWDGSSWTEVNNLNTQKYTAGSGIPVSTSGVAFGGNPYVANTEVWDGTNWTEVADLNTARMYLAGFGSATSAIAGNGIDPSASPPTYLQNKVEKWDGTSWTEVSEFNTARSEMLQGQGSSNASGIMSGGSTTGSNQIANTELWNGSSWTELNDLGTAKRMGAQIGSTSSGMYIAGQAPSPSTSVEHWESSLANKTITAS